MLAVNGVLGTLVRFLIECRGIALSNVSHAAELRRWGLHRVREEDPLVNTFETGGELQPDMEYIGLAVPKDESITLSWNIQCEVPTKASATQHGFVIV